MNEPTPPNEPQESQPAEHGKGKTKDKTPPTSPTTKRGQTKSDDKSAMFLGFAFWILLFGFLAWRHIYTKEADIMLAVSPAAHFAINGMASYDGRAVSTGKVELVFQEALTQRFISSTVLDVGADGTFAVASNASPALVATNRAVRITATLTGMARQADKNELVPVQGQEVLYTNYSPPLKKWTVWGNLSVLAVICFLLVFLFTGRPTQKKVRWLFSVSYLMTFLAIALPLAGIVIISQSHYLMSLMERSPVGLVKGKPKGVTDSQWLVNIGGIVTVPVEQAELESTRQATNAPSEGSADDSMDALAAPKQITGGIAIPFYVVLLALLGAGINMTRLLPDIQARYLQGILRMERGKHFLQATIEAPLSMFTSTDDTSPDKNFETVVNIRKEIIQQYMFLLSAPFLAIAVYYLIQIVAENIAEPVLVIMAFSAGLISESVVKAIVTFAEKRLAVK